MTVISGAARTVVARKQSRKAMKANPLDLNEAMICVVKE